MTRRPTLLAALLATTGLLTGCGHRQPAPTAPAASQIVQPSDQQLRQAAGRWLRSYLRIEVAAGRRDDLQTLYTYSTREVAAQVSLAPRPTNQGFPPAGRLTTLTLLPALVRGHFTVQAVVRRGPTRELWAIQLTASRSGPLVSAFSSAVPPRPATRQARA